MFIVYAAITSASGHSCNARLIPYARTRNIESFSEDYNRLFYTAVRDPCVASATRLYVCYFLPSGGLPWSNVQDVLRGKGNLHGRRRFSRECSLRNVLHSPCTGSHASGKNWNYSLSPLFSPLPPYFCQAGGSSDRHVPRHFFLNVFPLFPNRHIHRLP